MPRFCCEGWIATLASPFEAIDLNERSASGAAFSLPINTPGLQVPIVLFDQNLPKPSLSPQERKIIKICIISTQNPLGPENTRSQGPDRFSEAWFDLGVKDSSTLDIVIFDPLLGETLSVCFLSIWNTLNCTEEVRWWLFPCSPWPSSILPVQFLVQTIQVKSNLQREIRIKKSHKASLVGSCKHIEPRLYLLWPGHWNLQILPRQCTLGDNHSKLLWQSITHHPGSTEGRLFRLPPCFDADLVILSHNNLTVRINTTQLDNNLTQVDNRMTNRDKNKCFWCPGHCWWW